MHQEFIGQGWAFPLRVDATGGIALVSRERELEESMRIILGTAPGERPMRPAFGCGIHNYVFAGSDAATANAIAIEVRAALARWEPRVDIDDVVVTPDPEDRALLSVEVLYRPKSSNDPRNLVFPFYTIPGESEA
ncbi:MAG: GPW/gp25 family protein [Candidatus Dormiibacterota bacterium]